MVLRPHTRILLPLVLSGGACQDSLLSVSNATPRAVITAPAPGELLPDTRPLVLEGSVGDAESDPTRLTVTWRVDGAWVCPDTHADDAGLVRCELPPPLDRSQVRVTLGVRDPQGAPAADTRTFDVQRTGAPQVELLSPLPDAALRADVATSLRARATDAETAPSALTVAWSSDLDGVLASDAAPPDDGGQATASAWLSPGVHTLTVVVTDEDGKEGRATVGVVVRGANQPPTCAITAPTGPAIAGDPLVLQGQVDDDTDPTLLRAVWRSDLDGELGAGTPDAGGVVLDTVAGLSPGTHLLTLEVTDPDGATCVTTVAHRQGSPPTLLLVEPDDGTVFATGAPVRLTALVDDADDPPGDVDLGWTSSLQGDLAGAQPDGGGSATFTRTDLQVGLHTVEVRATDPLGLTAVRSLVLRVDTPPWPPTLQLSPAAPRTADGLVAEVSSPASDPDGDPVTLAWSWTKDGVSQPAFTGPLVPATATRKGEVWGVQALPSDGFLAGPSAEAFVVVLNSPPVLGPVSLARGGGTLVGAELTCGATPYDADGDPLTVGHAWVLQGAPVGTGTTWTVPAGGVAPPGSVVTCETVVRDIDGAEDRGSASAVIGNAPPTVDTVAITPGTDVDPATLLTCTATASDPDGEPPTLSWRWTRGDGTVLGTGATLRLTPTSAPPGTVVSCTATATDLLGGEATRSTAVVVLDPYPRIDAVDITVQGGGPARTTSTLVCSYAGFADPQGQADLSRLAWTVGGSVVGNTRFLSGAFVRGDQVTCTVTPSDGTWDGPPVLDTVLIEDTPPRLDGVTLAPAPALAGEPLTCAYSGFHDDDGDTDASTFAWTVDGSPAGNAATLPQGAPAGSEVVCTVTPRAGGAVGPAKSATLRIDSPPTAPGITVAPADPDDTDELSCLVSQPATDPDGDALTYTVAWLRDGALTAYGAARLLPAQAVTVPASATRADEVWTCEAHAHDGLADGPVARSSLEIGCLPHSGRGRSCPADSCLDALETLPGTPSGVTWIDPDGMHVFRAWCDQLDDDGGWTLVMQAATRSQLLYEHPWWTALDGGDDVPWSMSSDLDAVSRAFYRLQAVETRLCVRRFDDGAWACETMTHGKATAQVLANGAPLTSTRDTRDKLTPAILSIAPAGVWSATGFQRWGWNHGTRFCGGLRVGFSGDGDSTDSRDSAIGIGFHLENHICNPADYRALDYGAGFYHYPWPGHPEPWVAPLPVRVWMR